MQSKLLGPTCLLLMVGGLAWGSCATTAPVCRTFKAAGVDRVVLRAARAKRARLTNQGPVGVVSVCGIPAGGAAGYHGRKKPVPARRWGLSLRAKRYGSTLVISTRNEIRYLHHHYYLDRIRVRVGPRVSIVRISRRLSGAGAPDLRRP